MKKFAKFIAVFSVVTQLAFTSQGALLVFAEEVAAEIQSASSEESAPVVEESAPATETAVEETVVEETTTSEEAAVATEETSVTEETPVVEEEVVPADEAPAETTDVVVEDSQAPPVEESTQTETAPTTSSAVVVSPSLSTDKDDYNPGEVVTIFGNFFTPVKNFLIRIFGNSEVGNFWSDTTYTVQSNESGQFSLAHQLDNFYRPVYNVTATDESGNVVAEMAFKDAAGASVDVFDQCANDDGDGYNGNPGDCLWTNGNMNVNNSTIFEEDSTVQRLVMSGLTDGVHIVTLEYQTTKGGKHAYDFLTDFNQSETWVNQADLCAGDATTKFPGCASGMMTPSPAIPHDVNNISGTDDTNQNIGIINGTINSISAPALVSGSYAADSLTQINVTFEVDTATCANPEVKGNVTTCPVFMAWGAHVSSQADWGPGQSAVNISGSPYHMKVVALDGASTGNRDNQMSADALILPTQATLTLLKEVINDNGGTAVDTAWTLSASGPTPISGTEGQAAITAALVDAGEYTLSESGGPAGYTATLYSCVVNGGNPVVSNSLTLAADDVAVCTITNNDNAPSLTLNKVVVNNNGGSATPANFTLTATGPTGFSGAGPSVSNGASFDAGTYSLSESSVAGYTASAWVCVGGTQNGSDITVGLGQSATCTITNDDQPATITVVKTVINDNGGTAQPNDFNLTLEGNPVSSGVAVPVNPGTYTAGEILISGYFFTGFTGDCDSNGDVTVALGESKTCTLTNNDNAPSLTLNKIVINDNGGTASESAWTLSATGPTPISGAGAAGSADVVSGASFDAGSYILSESTGPAGYTASGWTCSNGDNDGTISIALGESVTCSITNDDNTAHLKLVKIVTNNNGGTTVATDFTLSASGPTPISGAGGVESDVDAGAYTLSETGVTGYTGSAWNCVGGSQNGSMVTLALGESATCTITNDDQTAHLTLVKEVINDNGGTSVATDWTLSATGPTPISGAGGADADVNAGTYNLSEIGPAGYSASAWVCDGGSQNGASVTLALGQSATCTITNDDISPRLIVIKHVINDNGGTSVAGDFTMNVTATNPSDASFPGVESPGTGITLDAGAYSVNETGPSGYAASFSADCTGTAEIGVTKTCTVTNNDISPRLIVIKHVINDDGGTAVASDFNLIVNDQNDNTNPNGQFSGEEAPGTLVLLDAGVYGVAESNVPGYSPSFSADCAGNIAVGEEKTCTVTNDDQPGHLIVHKVTLPTDTTTQFSITATGGTIESPSATQSIVGGATVDYTVHAGTYNVSEDDLAGWDETGNTCVDVVVVNGETEHCTITNTQRGHIIVVKNAIPDGSQSFTFQNNFANGNPASFNLVDDATPGLPQYDAEVLPGEYAVSEDAVTGWQLESATCDSGETIGDIDVAPGETVTCTFTNEKLAKIILVKNTIGGNGTFDFAMTGDTLASSAQLTTVLGTDSEEFDNIDPDNTYTIAETPIPAGWANTAASCDNGDAINNITPNAGEVITCTFVNNKPAAQIGLSPLDATNKVGDNHVITATVQTQDGDGVWGPAADNTLVTFSITNSNGATATFVGGNTCNTSGGACSITINSPTPGNVAVHASADPVELGVTLHVESDGLGDNSADAQKDYVNARISIATTETNEVGDDHVFTVTVEKMTGLTWDPVSGAVVDATPSPVPGTFDESDCTTGTDGSGQCTVTLNSDDAGVFTVNASTTISVGGVVFNLLTGTGAPNSAAAVKTYVDGSIALSPQTAVNKVGDPHTITAHVTKDEGSSPTNAQGVTVVFSVTSGSATFVGLDNDCVTDANGNCSVQIVSNTNGNNVIDATATYTVGGISITRATDGDSGPTGTDAAEKQYVNARISITPLADTNEVNDDHTFVVTVEQNTGSGWFAVPEGTVANAIVSPATTLDVSDCNDGVNASGQCNVIVNSAVAGVFTITARATVVVGGITFKLQTNGQGENSDPAVKTYVDAKIELTPLSATNQVNEPHTITVTVSKNPGTGYVAAAGEHVDFDLTDTLGSTAVLDAVSSTCDDLGANTDVNGQCTIVFSSATPGTVITHAEVDLTVGGVALHRETDSTHGSTGDANKIYEGGKIIVQKVTVGGDEQFTFDTDYAADFQLSNGQSNNSGYIPTGTHSVSEVVPAGWDLTSAVCDDGSNPASIGLSNEEVVTCTFTNTKRATVTVVKDAEPNDTQDFQFSSQVLGAFTLDDDTGVQDPAVGEELNEWSNTKTFQNVVPGSISITETQPNQYWLLDSATCVLTGTQTPVTSQLNGGTLTFDAAPGADITCTFQNDKITPTRTIGFWSTHLAYTTNILNTEFINGTMIIGDGNTHQEPLDSIGKVMGGFWSNIAKLSNGKTQRSALDKARMQLAQQLIAAKLNCAAFGCTAGVEAMITAADAAYAGTNVNAILTAAGQMDAYNNSGDTIIVGPTGKADPKAAKAGASYTFWDTP